MSFPSEFPTQAAQVFVQALLKPEARDTPRLALAGYDMLGFVLFKYFGDAKYLMQDAPLLTEAPESVQQTFAQMQTLDSTKPMPEWMMPLIMEAVQWLIKTLMERLNKPKT
jgi:hypothetical protein